MLAATDSSRPAMSTGSVRRSSARREHADGLRLVGVLEQDRELVAAEAGDGVGRAHRVGQALADVAQKLIAGVVPEAVVDLLEPVEVEHQHRHGLSGARRPGERMIEPVAVEAAVRERR